MPDLPGVFARALKRYAPKAGPRTWVWVNEDQLTDRVGPLARTKPESLGIVMIENHWRARLRPYHRQRLAIVWANQRHFAIEQAQRGVAVRYVIATTPFREALAPLARELGPLQAMTPAEREVRADVQPLVDSGALKFVPHEGWLTTTEDFRRSQKGPPWRMDQFYRYVRKTNGVLMEGPSGDRFVGGKLSFDVDNRERWDGLPSAAEPPTFKPDEVTSEVIAIIEREFKDHPGTLDAASIPATAEDAQRLWSWAKRACLPHFGPFEDAMSSRSTTIFHTRISVLMNLHRLLPRDIVRDAEAAKIPIESKEGFIRQILGWREFVKHVHDATDGFRTLPAGETEVAKAPGDAGFKRWSGRDWRQPPSSWTPDGGARTNHLRSPTPLPPAYWGTASGLNCVDTVVKGLWAEAYSHHITRLMVLSNLATLLDISPRELTDWFWVAYADAWDWVVEPNVLGMGTYSTGGVMTTKPYIAGSAYIDKMSDYCESCPLTPGTTCPFTRLYWAFLARHEPKLKDNARMMMPMRSLAKRDPDLRATDARVFVAVRDLLVKGQRITPSAMQTMLKDR